MARSLYLAMPLGLVMVLGAGCSDPKAIGEPQAPSCEEIVQDPAFLCEVQAPDVSMALGRDGKDFIDDEGRMVLLRGVNAGGRSKMPPFFPFPFAESGFPNQADAGSFDDELELYVDKIVEWGHNSVRLPFSWEAVEPVRGEYDEVFVGRLVKFAEHLAEREIRVILDFHQDVFSRHYCGDGFPLWAASPTAPEIPPIEACGSWFAQYLGDGPVRAEFARFWRNEDGLQDAFLAMWDHIIRETRHIEGVVGYEMLNEPFEGSIETDEWVADYYVPLVNEFAGMVAELAPDKTAVFGSPGADTLSGTTKVTRPEGDNIAFGPHFYDPVVYVMGTAGGKWNPPPILGAFYSILEDWNIPGFVGESGCRTKQRRCDEYIRAVYNSMDTFPWSVTTWEYSATVDDWNNEGFGLVDFGGVERPAANEVVRTYPHATAGTFGSFSFDRDSGLALYTYNATEGGVTEIRVPTRVYEAAPVVTVTQGDACVSYDSDRQMVLVKAVNAGNVSIRIERAGVPETCE